MTIDRSALTSHSTELVSMLTCEQLFHFPRATFELFLKYLRI